MQSCWLLNQNFCCHMHTFTLSTNSKFKIIPGTDQMCAQFSLMLLSDRSDLKSSNTAQVSFVNQWKFPCENYGESVCMRVTDSELHDKVGTVTYKFQLFFSQFCLFSQNCEIWELRCIIKSNSEEKRLTIFLQLRVYCISHNPDLNCEI